MSDPRVTENLAIFDSKPMCLIPIRPVLGLFILSTCLTAWGQSDHCLTERPKGYQSTVASYDVPAIQLRTSSGAKISLKELLESDQPVILQFIFTTCTTICPVMSSSLANIQERFDRRQIPYRMVSISIDPEYDTPKRLAAYATRFEAGRDWHFLTGTADQIEIVQKAFDAFYQGNNKMYHQPFTYLRLRQGESWLRLEGLLSGQQLHTELQNLSIPLPNR